MWISFSVLCSIPLTFMSVLLSVPHSYDFCCSVPQLCLTPCDPIDYSTPGFPVLYHLQELAQTHVHWVSDAMQPSHPLSSPSTPAFSLSSIRVRLPWWPRWWRICLPCRRPQFNSWVRKIPWRRTWQPTPVFLPGKSHGQRNLEGFSTWGSQKAFIGKP